MRTSPFSHLPASPNGASVRHEGIPKQEATRTWECSTRQLKAQRVRAVRTLRVSMLRRCAAKSYEQKYFIRHT